MNAARHLALDRAPAIRLAAFAALAALAGAGWMRMVAAPPVGRVALVVGLLTAGAVALVAIATARPGRRAAWGLAALAVVLSAAAGLVAVGVPAHLLDPWSWGELLSEIGRGFSGLAGDVKYPYDGENEWTRLVILAGLPVALALAAALAFWPARRGKRGRRTAPLAVLVATFGFGATVIVPEQPLVWGVLLLVGIGAWLWLPSLPTRDAIAGTALVAVAGLLALPIAGAIDSEEPWIDFREWEFGRSKPSTFDWNHSYDPLDWPRDGTVLAAMESDRPQYWRTAVLDEFDGVRWQRPEQSFGERLELPNAVEGDATEGSLAGLNRKWLEEVDVTVGPMESEFVLGAGAVVSADGLDSVLNLPNGTAVTGDEPLEEGDSYSVLSYAPDPSVRQLRAAPTDYSPSLARYTELTVPGRPIAEGNQFVDPAAQTSVEVPLRGTSGGSRAASRELADSPYAGAYRLAQRLTADEPTAFDATKAIERHFQTGFTYTENPPEHRVPLAGFLSTSRSGYCQQFSGAMALMLRMLGIPSRVVSGFSPGTADPDDEDRYLVEDLDAHSWVEAYFPKIGWVTFDPTPSGGAPATGRLDDSEIDSVGATTPSGNDPDNLRRKGFTPGEGTTVAPVAESSTFPLWIPAAIGIAGLLALAALAAITAVRRFRYSRLSPVAAAEAHLRELPLALTRLGWPYSPSDTLLDLEDVLLRHGKRTAPRYIAKLRTGRFAATHDGTPTLAERRALRDDLTASDGVRSRLRGLLALPPGGPG